MALSGSMAGERGQRTCRAVEHPVQACQRQDRLVALGPVWPAQQKVLAPLHLLSEPTPTTSCSSTILAVVSANGF